MEKWMKTVPESQSSQLVSRPRFESGTSQIISSSSALSTVMLGQEKCHFAKYFKY
jgi:hypothetical protein